MKTFASLFSGGEGAGIGAIAAGMTPVWGVEYNADIAEWGSRNIGHRLTVADVCTVDFEAVARMLQEILDWLHLSPPCTTASIGHNKAGEAQMDRDLAAACVRAIIALKPKWISLENVSGYQSYESYALIKQALTDNGYRFVEAVLNSADYGVPQTRRRLFLIASRTKTPVIPMPTHSRMGDMFTERWVSWWDAVKDLDLPKAAIHPKYRPIIDRQGPHLPVLLETRQHSREATVKSIYEPCPTMHLEPNRYKVVDSDVIRVFNDRAACRIMGVPDTYGIPKDRRLAGRIIGNMVCPPVQTAIIKAQGI